MLVLCTSSLPGRSASCKPQNFFCNLIQDGESQAVGARNTGVLEHFVNPVFQSDRRR